ncbi:MAG: TonB-dependent receptor [Chitinivibrionales bacterium]|nr:TonB-dependent receptor [Chitinivibrionales bacterium]MBD3357248.1 TonB-dependent receptor [Chitinivibrionales bacterium]
MFDVRLMPAAFVGMLLCRLLCGDVALAAADRSLADESVTVHKFVVPDSLTAGASAPIDTVAPVELERMVVTARRIASNRSAVTRINAEEIEGIFSDLPAVLEQVAGVTIRRTGGFGEYANASIRGGSPKQVQVYLDGIPLNTAAGGAVDLSKISLGSLQEITIYKGSAPLEIMGNTGGGVICLSTKPTSDMVNALFGFGSYGYSKAGVIVRKKSGEAINHCAVDYTNARNDYMFEHDNGTQYNKTDDTRERKHNNAYSIVSATYSNKWQTDPRNTLLSKVAYAKTNKELFHKSLIDALQKTDQTVDNAHGSLRWERMCRAGYAGAQLKGRWERRLFHDPLGSYYIGGERKVEEQFPYAEFQIDGLWEVSNIVQAKALVTAAYERYGSENILCETQEDPPEANRLFGSTAIELAANWGKLFLAGRYNHVFSRDSANFTPNHGGGISLSKVYSGFYPNANVDIVASIAPWLTADIALRREYLPITLSERYGWANGYMGNPNLDPECKTEISVGLTVLNGDTKTALAVFAGSTDDIIQLQVQSQNILMAQNTGDQRYIGFEWDAHVYLFDLLAFDNHLTFIAKRTCPYEKTWDNASTPLYHSPLENDFRINLSLGPFSIGHSVHYRSPYMKGYTKDNDLVNPMPIMNAYLSMKAFGPATFTYRVENYLNESIETMGHFAPLPGRMHFIAGQMRF